MAAAAAGRGCGGRLSTFAVLLRRLSSSPHVDNSTSRGPLVTSLHKSFSLLSSLNAFPPPNPNPVASFPTSSRLITSQHPPRTRYACGCAPSALFSSDSSLSSKGGKGMGVGGGESVEGGEGGRSDQDKVEEVATEEDGDTRSWSRSVNDQRIETTTVAGTLGERGGGGEALTNGGEEKEGKQLQGLLDVESEEEILSKVSDNFFEEHGISDDELDSLLAGKRFGSIQGLPPLEELMALDEGAEQRAARREEERRKQEEFAQRRVRRVDEFGRAYGTGRRKESTARVWVKEVGAGEGGKMVVNGKMFDEYFKLFQHRMLLLEPFVETDTLGKFSVRATVSGGGVSGQAGAMRHGISRALQSFDPSLHLALRNSGLLTRDPRAVERKKPGKAKARKSFQWVKR